jgi:hypothetical protein
MLFLPRLKAIRATTSCSVTHGKRPRCTNRSKATTPSRRFQAPFQMNATPPIHSSVGILNPLIFRSRRLFSQVLTRAPPCCFIHDSLPPAANRCAQAAAVVISTSFPPAKRHAGTITVAATTVLAIAFLIAVGTPLIPAILVEIRFKHLIIPVSGRSSARHRSPFPPRRPRCVAHMRHSAVQLEALPSCAQVPRACRPKY